MQYEFVTFESNEPYSAIITNLWTYANHGHSRSELLQIRELLNDLGISVEIVTLVDDYGISPRFSLGKATHRLRLDHSRYFKNWVDKRLIRDLGKILKRVVEISSATETQVALTSAKISHAREISRSWKLREKKVSIRFLDTPQSNEDWLALSKDLNESLSVQNIAFELKSSVKEAECYFSNVIHVPAAQSLHVESKEVNERRFRVGAFWPVGRSFNLDKIKILLEAIEDFKPIVKLPATLNTREFHAKYPQISFIKQGTPDEEFRKILSTIKVAVLGHENYVNQSSAYASYFVSNDVPVLTSKENAFFIDLEIDPTNSLEYEPRTIKKKIETSLKRDLRPGVSVFAEYSRSQWLKFLNYDDLKNKK